MSETKKAWISNHVNLDGKLRAIILTDFFFLLSLKVKILELYIYILPRDRLSRLTRALFNRISPPHRFHPEQAVEKRGDSGIKQPFFFSFFDTK